MNEQDTMQSKRDIDGIEICHKLARSAASTTAALLDVVRHCSPVPQVYGNRQNYARFLATRAQADLDQFKREIGGAE
jgi:hypothetical protein